MSSGTMSPAQLRRAGLDALARALGTVGMVRFLQQFEGGSGDYTSERHSWLDAQDDIDKVVDEIRRTRRPGQQPS